MTRALVKHLIKHPAKHLVKHLVKHGQTRSTMGRRGPCQTCQSYKHAAQTNNRVPRTVLVCEPVCLHVVVACCGRNITAIRLRLVQSTTSQQTVNKLQGWLRCAGPRWVSSTHLHRCDLVCEAEHTTGSQSP